MKNKLFSFNHSFFKVVGWVSILFLGILFISCGNAFNSRHSKSDSVDVSLSIPSEILKSIAERDAVAEQALAENQTVSVEVYFYIDGNPPIKQTSEVFDKQKGKVFVFPEVPIGSKVQATATIKIGNKEYQGASKVVEVVDEETTLLLKLTVSRQYLELTIEEAIEQVKNVRVNSNLKITGAVTNEQVEELFDSMRNVAGNVFFNLDLSDTTGLTTLLDGTGYVQSYSLPASLESISEGVLSYGGWIEDISFPNGNNNFTIDNNVLFNKDKTVLIRVITAKLFGGEYTIPSSVTKIEYGAFYNCWFETINIPSNVEEIGSRAFDSSYNLKSITVDAANKFYKSVDDVLFTADGKKLIQFPLAKNIDSYSIPEGTEIIGKNAFASNSLLKTVTIPSSIAQIESAAFSYSKIETITFENPNGWFDSNGNAINPSVLQNSDNLINNDAEACLVWETLSKMITIPVSSDNLYEAISSYSGKSLVLYEVSGTFTEDDLYNIKELIVDKLNSDWYWRRYVSLDLRKTTGLTEIYYDLPVPTLGIPASVTRIADSALYNVQNILLSSESKSFVLEDDVLYTADKTHLIWYSKNKQDKEFSIPSTVTTTGNWAFYGNSFIEKITLPQGLIQLGDTTTYNSCGLSGCDNLKTIVVAQGNNNYIVVDGVLFTKDKKALVFYPPEKQDTSYTIPNGTDLICWGAIKNNKYLKQITIPESVTKIGSSNFMDCESLETIIFKDTVGWAMNNGPNKQSVTAAELQNPASYRWSFQGGTELLINYILIKGDNGSSENNTNNDDEPENTSACELYYSTILLYDESQLGNYSETLKYLKTIGCVLQTDYTISDNKFILTYSGLSKVISFAAADNAKGFAVYDNQSVRELTNSTYDLLLNELQETTDYTITDNGLIIHLTETGYPKALSLLPITIQYNDSLSFNVAAVPTDSGIRFSFSNLPVGKEIKISTPPIETEYNETIYNELFRYNIQSSTVDLVDIYVSEGERRHYTIQLIENGYQVLTSAPITVISTGGSGDLEIRAVQQNDGILVTMPSQIPLKYLQRIDCTNNRQDSLAYLDYNCYNTSYLDIYTIPNHKYYYTLQTYNIDFNDDQNIRYCPSVKYVTIIAESGIGDFSLTNEPSAYVDEKSQTFVFSTKPVINVSTSDLQKIDGSIDLQISYSDPISYFVSSLYYPIKPISSSNSVDISDWYSDTNFKGHTLIPNVSPVDSSGKYRINMFDIPLADNRTSSFYIEHYYCDKLSNLPQQIVIPDDTQQTTPSSDIDDDAKCLIYYDDILIGGGEENSYDYSEMLEMLVYYFGCKETDYTITSSTENGTTIAIIKLNDSGLDKMLSALSQPQDPDETPETIVAIATYDNQMVYPLSEDVLEELPNYLNDEEYTITNEGKIVRLTLSGYTKLLSNNSSSGSSDSGTGQGSTSEQGTSESTENLPTITAKMEGSKVLLTVSNFDTNEIITGISISRTRYTKGENVYESYCTLMPTGSDISQYIENGVFTIYDEFITPNTGYQYIARISYNKSEIYSSYLNFTTGNGTYLGELLITNSPAIEIDTDNLTAAYTTPPKFGSLPETVSNAITFESIYIAYYNYESNWICISGGKDTLGIGGSLSITKENLSGKTWTLDDSFGYYVGAYYNNVYIQVTNHLLEPFEGIPESVTF